MNVPTASQNRIVIVAGTGMVGGYALRNALENPVVGSVTAIGRKKLGISHPKLEEVPHEDFADCSALGGALASGRSGVLPRDVYGGGAGRATPRYNRGLYDRVRASSPQQQPGRGLLILERSGRGPTGRSRFAFARYKGEAENAILAAGFPRVYLFRPAYIYPAEPRKEPNFSYRLLRAMYPAFRVLFPNQVIRADDLACAMVDVVVRETEERQGPIFENPDIRAMAESLHALRRRTLTRQ